MNLKSKAILGYLIRKHSHVTPENLILLIAQVCEKLNKTGQVYPEMFHGDKGRVYDDKSLRQFLDRAGIPLSQAG